MLLILSSPLGSPATARTSVARNQGALRRQLCWLVTALSLIVYVSAASAQQGTAAEADQLAKQIDDLYQQGKYADAVPLAQRLIEIRKRTVGEDHPDYAAALNWLAQIYNAQGQYDDAEPLYKRALAIREKTLGPEHPDVGATLNALGELYYGQGKYAEAESLYKQALVIRRKALGPDHADVAESLNDLAVLYDKQGKYGEAEPLYKQSLAIWEKALGPDHAYVAAGLNNLASMYQKQGRYAEAEPLYKRALAIDEKTLGPDHPGLATDLNNLAGLYVDQGQYEAAEPLFKRCLVISEKALGPDHPDVAASLSSLAGLYDEQGRYADAEPLYKRSLAIREKALGPEHPDVATSLNHLAGLYLEQGRYAEAEPLYKRALAIDEKALGPEHPNLASDLNNLAALYDGQGRYGAAEPLYKRALAIQEKALGPDHPAVADSLNDLATLYQEQGQYAEAEPLYKRSLAIWEKALGPEHPRVATSLNNLGAFYRDQGRYAEAEPFYKRSLAIREKALGPDHPFVAISLDGLAQLYREHGQYAEAEPLYKRSLAIFEKALGPDHPDVATCLNNIALLYEAQGQYAQAEPFFERALQNLSRQFENSFTYMSEKDRLAFLRTVSNAFPRYFSFSATYNQQIPELAGKVYDLLLWEKGMVASSVAAQRTRIAASGDAEALQLLDQLTAKKNQYAALAGTHPANYEQWRKNLEQVGEEANELEKELTRRSAGFAEQQKMLRPSWRDVQKSLQADEAAVEFVRFPFHDGKNWTGKSYYVALVVRPDDTTPQWVMLGETKDLEGAAMQDYRELVGPPGGDEAPPGGWGHKFYASFWQPLDAKLVRAKRIYLSPDGVLNQVALGVVRDGESRLLIERYDLRTVSSTKELLSPTVSPAANVAVLVGNPKFDMTETEQRAALKPGTEPKTEVAAAQAGPRDDASRTRGAAGLRSNDLRGGALEELEGTEQEVADVSALLKRQGWQVQTYIGKDALEERVKRVRQPRLLHLATHGFFEADQPLHLGQRGEEAGEKPAAGLEDPMLRSGVYLAGANRVLKGGTPAPDLDDGILTAYEATQLNLQGTELVVLSACDTGLGKMEAGEGVFGLRRGLQEAGAEAVLMSLWPVPDEETRELMTLFYTKWLAGTEKHEALREAQLEVRKKVRAREGQDEPFFWGAFVLVGR
ncbi:MAG: tetratricopeptide repeat protein [Candidatus Sulfotelmatobacter sp.]